MTEVAVAARTARRAALMALVAALIWGLWWIPVRGLEARGLAGAQASVTMSAGAALACLVWLVLSRRRGAIRPRALAGAALAGVALSTYGAALNHSDVVRVVLLFYLAPAWSKLIEWWFMGLPWRWTSTLALIAAGCGAYLVLGGGISGGAMRLGDYLALASGVAWAAGAALVFGSGRSDSMALTLATCGFGAMVGLALATFDAAGPWPDDLAWPLMLGLGTGAIYVLPMMLITLWSAQRLAPATLSFLLTAEILAGVISAALFLGEPFGVLQAAGAALIVLGALAEVLPSLARAAPHRS